MKKRLLICLILFAMVFSLVSCDDLDSFFNSTSSTQTGEATGTAEETGTGEAVTGTGEVLGTGDALVTDDALTPNEGTGSGTVTGNENDKPAITTSKDDTGLDILPPVTGEQTENGTGTGSAEGSTPSEPSEPDIPTLDFDGDRFTVLEANSVYTVPCSMMGAEDASDLLNAFYFKRNMRIEEQYNMSFEFWNTGDLNFSNFSECVNQARNYLFAGEKIDLIVLPETVNGQLALDGLLKNLNSVEEVQLDQDWWYSEYNNSLTLDGKLYSAMGGMNLSFYQSMNVLLFNQDMMEALGLNNPYDLVLEGNWTIEEFYRYLEDAVRSDDGDFTWNENGNTIYGYTNQGTSLNSFFFGMDQHLLFNQENVPAYRFNNRTEQFIDAIDALAHVLDRYEGRVLQATSISALSVLSANRTLFASGRLYDLTVLEEMRFGLLPFPKYSVEQKNYVASLAPSAVSASIPKDNADAFFSGTIADAMAYYGESEIVAPYLFKISYSQELFAVIDTLASSAVADLATYFGQTDFLDCQTVISARVIWEQTPITASILRQFEGIFSAQLDRFKQATLPSLPE